MLETSLLGVMKVGSLLLMFNYSLAKMAVRIWPFLEFLLWVCNI